MHCKGFEEPQVTEKLTLGATMQVLQMGLVQNC